MSMVELGEHYMPKGIIVSPVRQRIVRHLKENGVCSTVAIVEMLLQARLVTADELAEKPAWVNNQLAKLQQAGHIVRRYTNEQLLVWASAPADGEHAEAPPVAVPGVKASARQVNVMHGPVYVPMASPPTRAGALDLARAPSLMGSRRVAYRGGM